MKSAASGTSQVALNIVDASRGAGETGSASNKVLSSAHALSRESRRLTPGVERFLGTART